MNYMKIIIPVIISVLAAFNAASQVPCENGFAGGYPCNQIDLYAHIDNDKLSRTTGVDGNDIWGWTDPKDGKEYVLMGQTNGVVFVDISQPTSPKIIGRLASHNQTSSAWRDIKVYKNHAFIVADNISGHGMQVFDLTRLRNAGSSPVTFDVDAHYDGVSSAHNIVINEETGYAYIVGARNAGKGCGAGGLHIVDIRDPKKPKFAACFDADGYTHDAQCVIYIGPDMDYQGKEICFNANENTFTIANVDDKGQTSLISKVGYPKSAYAHQGWLTDDHQYFISNDELDEKNNRLNTRTLIWDVRDLNNPILINEYFSERKAIDHNMYLKNKMIFQANYTDGLIVLDAKRAADANLREIAYFDSYPQGASTTFHGAWSNYPFFESGIIAISDIDNGLFLVKLNMKDKIQQHPAFTSCGADAVLKIEIEEGQSVSSYQWQAVNNSVPLDLTNDINYSGVNSAELTINPAMEGLNDMRFRCKVKLTNGNILTSYLSNYADGLPRANFSTSINSLEVQFENNTLAGQAYEWDFGDGSEVSTAINPTHVYESPENYEVKLTASSDCGESVLIYNINLTQCLPIADFIVTVDEGEISFINLSRNANMFEWDFGDGSPIVTVNSPVYTYDSEDTHEVTLTAYSDCGVSTVSLTIDDKVLHNKNILDQKVTVYPNPVQNQLFVSYEDLGQIQNVSVFSTGGRKMYVSNSLLNNQSIDMSAWETGVYFLVIRNTKGEQAVKKVIKK